jgi:tetratricopeptide (TPR) repeat protein
MTQKATTVGAYSRTFIIMQVIAVSALVALLYLVVPTDVTPFMPLLIGAAVYLIWSRLSMLVLLRAHRTGIQFLRAGAYAPAIQQFEQSYALFARFPWLDNFRWLTLLSPSALSYREMALNNIGYAFVQLKKFGKARERYQQLLDEYPDGEMADAARTVLASIDKRS